MLNRDGPREAEHAGLGEPSAVILRRNGLRSTSNDPERRQVARPLGKRLYERQHRPAPTVEAGVNVAIGRFEAPHVDHTTNACDIQWRHRCRNWRHYTRFTTALDSSTKRIARGTFSAEDQP